VIEKILKPKKPVFHPATVTAVDAGRRRITAKLPNGLTVIVDDAGLTWEVGDTVVLSAVGKDGARIAVQKAASVMPATQMTVVV